MKKIFITISLLALTACIFFEKDNPHYWLNNIRSYKTLPINYYDSNTPEFGEKLTSSRTLNTRTYKHNVIVSANLGQRMVDAQTYTVKNYTAEKIVATTDGQLYNISHTVDIHEGDVYTPLGEVKFNGQYYLLVDPQNNGNILLIDEDGKFLNMICRIYRGELLLSREKAVINPQGLGVEQDINVREVVDKPKLQFEIKYDGLENGMMAFIYTDYSNASSTEGYFQRFTFPQEQELVDINGIKFKVMDVYPDRIEYMLLD